MDLSEGKQRFIEHWGRMGPEWGINRCMAQIHALLLISAEPLCSETIMEELSISRGSVNTNLRALMDWELVKKKLIPGERKEFFVAVKDIWAVFKRIVENRRKRELSPLRNELSQLKQVRGENAETKEFMKILNELCTFTIKADSMLDMLLQMDRSFLEQEEFPLIS